MSGDPMEDPTGEDLCPDCGGSGRVEGGGDAGGEPSGETACPTCGGSGTVEEPVGGG